VTDLYLSWLTSHLKDSTRAFPTTNFYWLSSALPELTANEVVRCTKCIANKARNALNTWLAEKLNTKLKLERDFPLPHLIPREWKLCVMVF